ncbi:MAG: 16S rRNA (adenine(1518)-N(6)/adenine(1519)-N(6))-dimethyltransferase RsmA [Gammaproteobacteria bacterium]|nr:16S rRNA (adenine(1518)-N(6)/adenine(1519)-N(6))-dimethyltransferase RsmA [Gammaproteobacteria bacterium]
MAEHIPRKRFGQNFLHDQHVIQRIIGCIAPEPGDTVTEIGPGLGALTNPLLQKLQKLDVIELDRDLADRLEQHPDYGKKLFVHRADALKFEFCSLAGNGKLRIVGNLPYNISTPLIFHLLTQQSCIRDMTFMLQKEVVDRIVAAPGGKDYGRLSIMVQAQCRCQRLFIVKPGAFNPPPKVDSAIVQLVPEPEHSKTVISMDLFERVVRQAFSQRRKTLRNTLKGLVTVEQLQQTGIDAQNRPEALSVDEYIAISNLIANQSPG